MTDVAETLMQQADTAPLLRGGTQNSIAHSVKGATDYLKDGRALLRFFKGHADASTYVHEAAHMFMPTLDASDMDELAKFVGLERGDDLRLLHERWVRKDPTLGKLPSGKRADYQFREMGKATSDAERYAIAQEKFARGFEKYLSEGVAPTEGLQHVFEQFKDFLLEVYRGITGSEIDLNLTDEMRALYGRVFTTRVGVNRIVRNEENISPRIPHTRGGEPLARFEQDEQPMYSPHAWG